VCINQLSLEERSLQVGMMGDVYKWAHRVLVWLGEGDAGSKNGSQTFIILQRARPFREFDMVFIGEDPKKKKKEKAYSTPHISGTDIRLQSSRGWLTLQSSISCSVLGFIGCGRFKKLH